MKNQRTIVRKGFTMIELMAMLIIIGLLATLVVTKVSDQIDKARVTTTKVNLKTLHQKIVEFALDNYRYPTEDEGLDTLIIAPSDVTNYPPDGYLDTSEVPTDAWGNDFYYELNPETGGKFMITSWGADGEEGGEGYDADLHGDDAN